MIENLNKIISNNSNILYKIQPDPYIIKQLERIIDLRKRDLNSSKKLIILLNYNMKKCLKELNTYFLPEK